MTRDPEMKAVLRRSTWARDELTEVTARFRTDGALEVEYYTTGPSVANDTGDSDYEHFTIVDPQHLDELAGKLMAELTQLPPMRPGARQRNLLTLLEECFASDPIPSTSIERWLDANGIPYRAATM